MDPLRFRVNVKDNMVWKPSAVQLRHCKSKNVGSYFEAKSIRDSPVLEQARKNNIWKPLWLRPAG